jgi:hypothetical protein
MARVRWIKPIKRLRIGIICSCVGKITGTLIRAIGRAWQTQNGAEYEVVSSSNDIDRLGVGRCGVVVEDDGDQFSQAEGSAIGEVESCEVLVVASVVEKCFCT